MIYWILFGLILIGSTLLRILPQWNYIFTETGIRFTEVDPYYHIRLLENLIANWPKSLIWDSYANLDGAIVGVQPLLSSLASLGYFLTGIDYKLIAVFIPPISGLLTLVVVWFITKIQFGKAPALIAVLSVGILPTELLHRTFLGYFDHHCMEILLFSCILLGFVIYEKGKRYLGIGILGISLGLYFLNWWGSIMILIIYNLWVALKVLFTKVNYKFLLDSLLALLLGILIWSPLTDTGIIQDPKVFFLGFGATLGFICSMLIVVNKSYLIKLGAISGIIVGGILGVIIVGAQELLLRGLLAIFWGFGSTIQEAAATEPQIFMYMYGLFILFFILGWWNSFKDNSKKSWILLIVGILYLILAIGQRRWTYYFTIPVGVLGAWGLWITAQRLPKQILPGVLTFLLILSLLPAFRSTQLMINQPITINSSWINSLNWLKENTEEPFIEGDIYLKQVRSKATYGVLSWWDYGHWIIQIGHRVPLTSPTQQVLLDSPDCKFFTAQTEEEARQYEKLINFKYLIVDRYMVTDKFYAISMRYREITPEDSQKLRETSEIVRIWNGQDSNYKLIHYEEDLENPVMIFERLNYGN